MEDDRKTTEGKTAIVKKMLYCMHVGWNWIKQRPQFIAEELSKQYDVTVVSDYTYRMKRNQRTRALESPTLHIKNFYKIPRIDTSKYFAGINNQLRKLYYSRYLKKLKPEYMYVTIPSAIACIPEWYQGKVIYDCMDDMLEFSKDDEKKKQIASQEKKLIERSAITLVTSENLKKQLCIRYPEISPSKYRLVRNGYNGQETFQKKEVDCQNNRYVFCYFGTIAEWINFQFIEDSLKIFPDIEYLMIGPFQAGTKIPQHPRIRFVGSIEHCKLSEAVQEADAFIMPFMLAPLIESVDPVKLYEYINFNKNILCVEYPEVQRFGEFVYFYKEFDTFVEQIKNMKNASGLKYSEEQRMHFLKENTWENRGKCIYQALEELEC